MFFGCEDLYIELLKEDSHPERGNLFPSRMGITLVRTVLMISSAMTRLNMGQILRLQSLSALSLRMTNWLDCRSICVNYLGEFKKFTPSAVEPRRFRYKCYIVAMLFHGFA